MADRDITLWLDERWYDALTHYLPSGSVQEKLEERLPRLLDHLNGKELPQHAPTDIYMQMQPL